jgi:hypothetical protein
MKRAKAQNGTDGGYCSPRGVTTVTESWCGRSQNRGQESYMPVLMVALIALVAFGLIGVLQFTAGTLERRTKKDDAAPASSARRPG